LRRLSRCAMLVRRLSFKEASHGNFNPYPKLFVSVGNSTEIKALECNFPGRDIFHFNPYDISLGVGSWLKRQVRVLNHWGRYCFRSQFHRGLGQA
jgi:hypothetical protein